MEEQTKFDYNFEEYSQDSRHWLITSTKKLTENELHDLWSNGFHLNEHSIEVIRFDDGHKVEVAFRGTEYGDDAQCLYSGEFYLEIPAYEEE